MLFILDSLSAASTGDTLTFADATGTGTYLGFDYHSHQDIYLYSYQVPITFSDGQDPTGGSFQNIQAYTTAPQDYEVGAQAGNFSQAGGSAGLGNDNLTGGSGDDSFVSSGGSDTIDGGDGQDEFVMLGSSDRFSITSGGDGAITLTDRNGVEGQVVLKSIESIAFLGDDATKGIANGTAADDVMNTGAADIAIGGGGNDIITAGDQGVTLFGGSGNDQITGGAGDDTITGGTGADQLSGGLGNDIYRWASGDGSDTITDSGDDGAINRLEMTGVKSFALDLSQDGDDLLIGSGAEQLRIVGQFALSGVGGLDSITFDNGRNWDRNAILDHAAMPLISGTSEADQLVGSSSSERFQGGAGDDTYQSSGGDDRYVWNVGDGNDRVVGASVWSDGSDTVVFGPSINPADVSVQYVGGPNGYGQPSSLVLTYAGGGSVQLDGFSASETHQVNVRFADGTAWDPASLAQRADALPTLINGTSGADYLDGWDRPDQFNAGQGDDTLNGNGGSDIYLYATGDGADTIIDYGSGDNTDVLKMVNLNQSDIHLSREGSNLLVTDLTTSETITVQDQFSDSTTGIEKITFSDGSELNRDPITDIASMVYGTSEADYLSVSWSKFTVIPGAGDDSIYLRGSGAGTVVFGSGDGHDYMWSDTGWGYTRGETLQLRDANPGDVTLTQDGEGLVITLNATGDTFTAGSQFNYYDEPAGFEKIHFADGTIWDRNDIAAHLSSGGGFAMMATEMPEPRITGASMAFADSSSIHWA